MSLDSRFSVFPSPDLEGEAAVGFRFQARRRRGIGEDETDCSLRGFFHSILLCAVSSVDFGGGSKLGSKLR